MHRARAPRPRARPARPRDRGRRPRRARLPPPPVRSSSLPARPPRPGAPRAGAQSGGRSAAGSSSPGRWLARQNLPEHRNPPVGRVHRDPAQAPGVRSDAVSPLLRRPGCAKPGRDGYGPHVRVVAPIRIREERESVRKAFLEVDERPAHLVRQLVRVEAGKWPVRAGVSADAHSATVQLLEVGPGQQRLVVQPGCRASNLACGDEELRRVLDVLRKRPLAVGGAIVDGEDECAARKRAVALVEREQLRPRTAGGSGGGAGTEAGRRSGAVSRSIRSCPALPSPARR